MSQKSTQLDRALISISRSQLSDHPILKAHPTASRVVDQLTDTSAGRDLDETKAFQWQQLFASTIEENGVIDPLDVCLRTDGEEGYWVLDGRHRLESSSQPEFLCLVHDPAIAEGLILTRLFDRRHISSEQKAWFVVLTWPELADRAGKVGRPRAILKGRKSSVLDNFTLDGFAARYMIRRESLAEAVKTYQKALDHDKLAEFSAMVWAGSSLGAIRAGLGGAIATKDHARPEVQYDTLAKKALQSFKNTFSNWEKVPTERRTGVIKHLRELVAAIPESVRKEVLL